MHKLIKFRSIINITSYQSYSGEQIDSALTIPLQKSRRYIYLQQSHRSTFRPKYELTKYNATINIASYESYSRKRMNQSSKISTGTLGEFNNSNNPVVIVMRKNDGGPNGINKEELLSTYRFQAFQFHS